MLLAIPVLVLWHCSGAVVAAGQTEPPGAQPTVSTALLPGGVEGLRRALGDPVAMPPALVGAEIARRFYGGSDARFRDVHHARLTAWLHGCAEPGPCRGAGLVPDRVPLPGDVAYWRDVVLGVNASPDTILLSIFLERRATLLYTALLSLDEPTRAWMLGEQRALAGRLSESQIGALVVAAPYLRVAHGAWILPGGDEARPIWMALANASSADPGVFIPAFLSAGEGLLAYLAEVTDTVSPGLRRVALGLHHSQSDDRVRSARGFLGSLRAALPSWHPGARPFWRSAVDPGLFLAQVNADASGSLRLPGGRRFWDASFDGTGLDVTEEAAREAWRDPAPVEPAWLVARVFSGAPGVQVTRAEQVLMAAHWRSAAREDSARDLLVTLRAHARFPELLRVLDRIGVADPRLMAEAIQCANRLANAGRDARAGAVRTQWQSALLLLMRTVERGGTAPADGRSTVADLARAGPGARRGAILRSVAAWLGQPVADLVRDDGAAERLLIDRLSADDTPGRSITWEDTDYRIDFGAAERARLDRVRSRAARGRLDAALAAVDLADRLESAEAGGVPPPQDAVTRLNGIVAAVPQDTSAAFHGDFLRLARHAAAAARRHLGAGRRATSKAGEALYDLADALGAGALLEVAYAAHMGWGERLPLKADAAMQRHRFAIEVTGTRVDDLSWLPPRITTGADEPWHVGGGVLGLDVALAPLALRRLSMKPPVTPPRLTDGVRELFTTTVVLLDRRRFTDDSQRQLVSLVARARARLNAAATGDTAAAIAADAGVSPLRTTLAPWLAANDPPALGRFFSLTEQVRIGLEGRPIPEELNQWGNRARLLTGRDACGPLPALFWERYAGRRQDGLVAYAVPDLQLALGLRLAELNLPAVLVPDLVSPATHDFLLQAPTAHPDDWRAMVDQAAGLTPQAVERYLNRLTTDGPLRPDVSRVSERE